MTENFLEEDLSEAVSMVASLRVKRRAAELDRADVQLSAPGCARACIICRRRCAVLGIMLDWWERRLASLSGAALANVTVH